MALSQVPSSAPNFVIDQGLEYYAGKTELLDWINRLLALNLTRLEQLTSGAVYCQILDAFHAEAVAIRKVNFWAREEYEIIPNYKVLQAAFDAREWTKELDVAKLSRASSSDLMEFAQWLYKTYKCSDTVPGYNPMARRQLSVKGGTNNIPLPACVVNSAFEFSRIDLRTSGNWGAAATPTEPASKSSSRTQRSLTNTPGTGGKPGSTSGSKRTPLYLNVASRYKEGLAAPPEHYERRSPRFSPGSSGGALLRKVPTSHGGTQTDFVDEEYRPMTAADVGTEAVSPRVELRDYAVQYEDGLAYNNSLSPAGSTMSPSSSAQNLRELASGNFSFGRQRSGIPPPPAFPLSPGASVSPSTSSKALRVSDGHGPAPGGSHGGGSVAAMGPSADSNPPASATASLADSRGVQAPAFPPSQRPRTTDDEAVLVGSLGGTAPDVAGVVAATGGVEEPMPDAFATAAAAAAFAMAGDMDGGMGALGPGSSATPRKAEAKPSDEVVECSFGMPDPASASSDAAPAVAGASRAKAVGTGDQGTPPLATPDRGAAPLSARGEHVTSPGGASSTATASPSPRSGQRWRSMGAMLPPDVASLLASPVARTRLASPSCLRDMATALDVCAAALQAAEKSLTCYGTLLAAPAEQSASGSGHPPECSPALCGKARSLQDALQTLLEHTSLLLADVQAYSQATHTQEQQSPRQGASPGAEPEKGSATPGRNFSAEAAALLERARSQEDRLQALKRRAEEALQLPPGGDAAVGAADGDEAAAAVAASPRAASSSASAGPPVNRHLTDEQRKLASTTQLDAHLKAVGMAQFALVQDIHKELAALTTTYFRHTAVTNGGEGASNGGGEGSAGGVSTSSNRKARVFKLGEYQLKQLRNGDIYKGRYVCNKKNGEGVYHFINADVFEGEFRDDRMDGHGVYTFSHEGRYEGQWRNAVYNGTGAETFAKGSTYHGEYAGGLRNGWGVCRFYNGDYYEGQWAKGLRDGSGMQQCTDDSNFVGDYQRGKRHGHGVYSFPNGDRYEGQYLEDLPHGHGTYHFASGQCYQGQWQQGKKHGWSVYTVDNGSRFMGLWSEGKPTWVQPLQPDGTTNGAEDSGRSLRQALDARDKAKQAAAEARKRAAGHWDVSGPVQTRLQVSLSQAQASAALAQQARRKACDLAARLDAAVALLQTQGAGAPVASATP